MRFNIKGLSTDIEVTTVVLEHNPNIIQKDSPEGLILWHCPIDNQPLFQFSGRQVMIIPGMVPTKIPIIVQCSKCHTRYLVLSVL
jgi:hypothetical protein